MKFSGEFKVPGLPEQVMRTFTDVERMASCMPGATLDGKDEDGNYIGGLVVSFGPKRIKFKGKMQCEYDMADCSGLLTGRGATDIRAARVGAKTRFFVVKDPASAANAPMSIVRIDSEAELGGVIAEFARTGGTALANVLMKEFAANLAREMSGGSAGEQAAVNAISVHHLLWNLIKLFVSNLKAKFRLRSRA